MTTVAYPERTAAARTSTLPTVTEVQAVLEHFGHPAGLPAGDFTSTVLHAAAIADPANRRRLAGAYPGLVGALHAVRIYPDALEMLAEHAEDPRGDAVVALVTRALFTLGALPA